MKYYKVAINSCYGGFSLSEKAAQYLANLGNEEAKAHLDSQNYWTFKNSFLLKKTQRHDKNLIKCIEELGEEANGTCAKIEIEEITVPAYSIDEHDGKEYLISSNSDYFITD